MSTTTIDVAELFAFCDLHTSRWRARRLAIFNDLSLAGSLPMYYDKQGFPIPGTADDGSQPPWFLPVLQWARLKEDHAYSRVAWDEFPDGSYLSTVWMGLDMSHGLSEPLIFETMYFGGEIETVVLPFSGGEQSYHPSREVQDPRGEPGETTDTWRYRTEEEALAMHREIARRIRKRWEV